MTAAGKKPSRRYSRESQQEDRSEGQIKERFAELGWPCDRVGRDLGEDLRVRIFDDGQSTGLELYVQLKSTANAAKLERKKSPALAYPLEVKDLLHWEVSTTLVVLVVWDVEQRLGWWRPVPEILKALDEAGKGWRKKKTATATVPLANATDATGMARLRRAVADHNLPLVVPATSDTIALVFDSDNQQSAIQDFLRAVDFDEPLTLEGPNAPKIQFPEWHRRLYGHAPVVQLTKLEKGRTIPSIHGLGLRIEVSSSEGPADYPYVELRPTVQGQKRLVLTNEHQMLPLVFSITFNEGEETVSFNFRRARFGRTAQEARAATHFMLAAAAPDASVHISAVQTGSTMPVIPAAHVHVRCDRDHLRAQRDLLDKLCFIQQKVAHLGAFQLDDARGLSPQDVSDIDQLFEICRSGRLETTVSMAFEIPPGVRGHDMATISHDALHFELLGLSIPLGDMRAWFVDAVTAQKAVRAAAERASSTGKPALVELESMRVVQEFTAWLPVHQPWAAMYDALDRLAEAAGPSDGYFTRADARAAGAGDAVFDALLSEHKVEPIAPDVYHLTHFPHADREDLVVLWLQTERRGVISHETALHILDLCDILPSHLHITVPPGWTPEARALSADVEIRYGEVPKSDLRWLGAVPYTGPLRTVRDCIKVGVSRDLIEQAVAEGIRRGLFTDADFPALPRAESA